MKNRAHAGHPREACRGQPEERSVLVLLSACSLLRWNQLVVAICRACARHRLASSILNLFSLCGLALRMAASPALRKLAALAGLPVSAASASGDRQGLVPTPPNAMRA